MAFSNPISLLSGGDRIGPRPRRSNDDDRNP
jgi:hypothetical protein